MIIRYDGTENGFFTACLFFYQRGDLPTRILRSNRATAPKQAVTDVRTEEGAANEFRELLRGISPALLGEVCLALRRLDEGVPLAVMRYALLSAWGKEGKNPPPREPYFPFAQYLQMVKLELYRYAGTLQFFEENGVFCAKTEPIDDVADLILLSVLHRFSAPVRITDTLRNKSAAFDGTSVFLEGEEKRMLTEHADSILTLRDYLAPKRKVPVFSEQLSLFAGAEDKNEREKPFRSLAGVWRPVKKAEE